MVERGIRERYRGALQIEIVQPSVGEPDLAFAWLRKGKPNFSFMYSSFCLIHGGHYILIKEGLAFRVFLVREDSLPI